jgi:hypothetical protein
LADQRVREVHLSFEEKKTTSKKENEMGDNIKKNLRGTCNENDG